MLFSSSLLHLFFLMIRRPPRSTLFPYTTLPIYVGILIIHLAPHQRVVFSLRIVQRFGERAQVERPLKRWTMRSEEHTSELQSLTNLVCRLLLEKKKKKNIKENIIIMCRSKHAIQ